jgi:hypothetical protein
LKKSDSFRYVRRNEEEMAVFLSEFGQRNGRQRIAAGPEQNSLSRFSSLQLQRQRDGGHREANLHFIQIYF